MCCAFGFPIFFCEACKYFYMFNDFCLALRGRSISHGARAASK